MDRYSKLILTIIAVALMLSLIKDISVISEAHASNDILRVKVVELDIPGYRPIPVKVQGKLECHR